MKNESCISKIAEGDTVVMASGNHYQVSEPVWIHDCNKWYWRVIQTKGAPSYLGYLLSLDRHSIRCILKAKK